MRIENTFDSSIEEASPEYLRYIIEAEKGAGLTVEDVSARLRETDLPMDLKHPLIYSPSDHFRHHVLSSSIIDDLVKDPSAKLLSVGSGYALLERLLVEKLGVSEDQIAVSDHLPVPWPNYLKNTVVFNAGDLRQPWPFKQKYKYIIFPMSMHEIAEAFWEVAETRLEAKEISNTYLAAYILILKRAAEYLEPGGEIRLSLNFAPEDPVFINLLIKHFSRDFLLQHDVYAIILKHKGRDH